MITQKDFEYFIKNTVNLNKSRVDVAESGIEIMKTFIENNDIFQSIFIDAVPQGSFRQQTIIKPVDSGKDFDVDLLLEMKKVDGWEPKDYLLKLGDEFRKTDRYKNLVDTRHHKERCVTIDYESDFHIDLVPAIRTTEGYKIMNKKTNQFEPTDGDGYADWFAKQNDVMGNKHLIKVTRLLKYIRDRFEKFEIKSILLTTLLGNMVNSSDAAVGHYADIKISFVTLIGRLDSFLRANPNIPTIKNPALECEDFNRKWTQEKYSVFRAEINRISKISIEAAHDNDQGESLKKWQKIFGDNFTCVTEDDVITPEENAEIYLGDYSHREMPSWPKAPEGSVEIVKCRVGGRANADISSNSWAIPSGLDLTYIAKVTGVNGSYEVFWQVVNTGDHAKEVDCLRGNIEKPKDPNFPLQQAESSGYTGKHWIQCFVVKNGFLVAESKPFFLNVVNKRRKRLKFGR